MEAIDNATNPAAFAKYYTKMEITGTNMLDYREIADLVKKYVKGTKTLDFGCGSGQSTNFLKSLGLEVEGVDINKYIIEEAKRKNPNGIYKVIENNKIPAEDERYDFVLARFVLDFVPTKESIGETMKEIRRVLKPNGIFIFVTGSSFTYNTKWLSYDTDFEENKNLKSGSMVKILFKDIGMLMTSYYWTEEDYREMAWKSELTLHNIVFPLGRDGDEYEWVNEKKKYSSVVYVTQKVL